MTTFYKENAVCAVCGSEKEYEGIASTNMFGSLDLDTRPPEMKRSTIFAWVQRCPQCGYCAVDVTEPRPGAQVVVSGEEYRNQLNDPEYPELANSFLCQAIVDRESGDYVDATWALIHAAWVCDDFELPAQAGACRQKAADMLAVAEAHGQQVAEQEGASTVILVDLLRRSNQLQKARQLIATGQGSNTEDIIWRILDFQSTLLDRNDVSCHTVAEALAKRD
jgi:hypothetical protein